MPDPDDSIGARNLPDLIDYLLATARPLPDGPADLRNEVIDRIKVAAVAATVLSLFTAVARYDSELFDVRPDIARSQLVALAEVLRGKPDLDSDTREFPGVDRAAIAGFGWYSNQDHVTGHQSAPTAAENSDATVCSPDSQGNTET